MELKKAQILYLVENAAQIDAVQSLIAEIPARIVMYPSNLPASIVIQPREDDDYMMTIHLDYYAERFNNPEYEEIMDLVGSGRALTAEEIQKIYETDIASLRRRIHPLSDDARLENKLGDAAVDLTFGSQSNQRTVRFKFWEEAICEYIYAKSEESDV